MKRYQSQRMLNQKFNLFNERRKKKEKKIKKKTSILYSGFFVEFIVCIVSFGRWKKKKEKIEWNICNTQFTIVGCTRFNHTQSHMWAHQMSETKKWIFSFRTCKRNAQKHANSFHQYLFYLFNIAKHTMHLLPFAI